jgi:serine-type D-Ala-D-Ala carboxypeptidase (penicillin-binding protein 5/6)
MKKSLIIVFIVIVALHFAGLLFFLFLQKKSDGEQELPEPDSPPVLVPEPIINQQANSILNTPVSGKKIIKKTVLKKISKKVIKKNSGPLNFKKAVIGNIKSLPQSKKVKAGILVDADSRRVLWSKNSGKAVPIASMTKMMTVLLVSEDIKNGKISPKQPIKVTKAASSIGGSDVWLDPRETFPLNELLKAIVIKSANDAAYLVAENSGGGDVRRFVQRMNDRAGKLGLKSAKFSNPHGLPEDNGKDNVCSCEDMVVLAEELLKYPEILKLSSTKIDYLPRKVGKIKKTMLLNTNKLIRKGCPGVDGIKTGYTRKAGSCITVTCNRNDRRLIMVLAGCKGSKLRDEFAVKLLDWGYGKK